MTWHVFETGVSDKYIDQYDTLHYVGKDEDKPQAVAMAEDRYLDNARDDYYVSCAVDFDARAIVVFGPDHPFGGEWDEEYATLPEWYGPQPRIKLVTMADVMSAQGKWVDEFIASVTAESELLKRLTSRQS